MCLLENDLETFVVVRRAGTARVHAVLMGPERSVKMMCSPARSWLGAKLVRVAIEAPHLTRALVPLRAFEESSRWQSVPGEVDLDAQYAPLASATFVDDRHVTHRPEALLECVDPQIECLGSERPQRPSRSISCSRARAFASASGSTRRYG